MPAPHVLPLCGSGFQSRPQWQVSAAQGSDARGPGNPKDGPPPVAPPSPGWTAYQLPGGLLLPRQVKTLAYSDTGNEQLCISQAAPQRQQAWLT